MNDGTAPANPVARQGFSGAQVVLIAALAMVLAAGATYWFARAWLFPRDFEPVELSVLEREVLAGKLEVLTLASPPAAASEPDQEWLRPEAYREQPSDRTVVFSERELNGLIARDPQLARRLAIDLADGLASARALVPVDPDFPLLGGKTLRIHAGLALDYQQARPVIRLRGVSVMGVPVPNAWLGGLKNTDLVAEFGGRPGFWKSLADGIADVRVADGQIVIQLRE